MDDEEFFKTLSTIAKRYDLRLILEFEGKSWEALIESSRHGMRPYGADGEGTGSTPRIAMERAMKGMWKQRAFATQVHRWTMGNIVEFGQMAGMSDSAIDNMSRPPPRFIP